jgi:hypothetical protein
VDYAGNSKKAKGEGTPEKKEITKVVTGTVVVKKKSFLQKVKGVFIEADFRSVAEYVVSNVLIPAARGMIVDSATKGIERMMYGDRAPNRGGYGAPRMTYGSGSPMMPTNYRAPQTRPPISGPRYPRAGTQDYVIPTRDEAMAVLQMMHDVIEMYTEVSVAEYHEMLGLPINSIEHKWGWKHLVGSQVRPDRDGYILELPAAEPLQ